MKRAIRPLAYALAGALAVLGVVLAVLFAIAVVGRDEGDAEGEWLAEFNDISGEVTQVSPALPEVYMDFITCSTYSECEATLGSAQSAFAGYSDLVTRMLARMRSLEPPTKETQVVHHSYWQVLTTQLAWSNSVRACLATLDEEVCDEADRLQVEANHVYGEAAQALQVFNDGR